MKHLSILEKLSILKSTATSSIIFLVILVVLSILVIIFSTTTRMNVKKKNKFYIGLYFIAIIGLLVMFHNSLIPMFDYMMDNLFVIFCFPNLASYLVAIITTNIILWITTLNGKENKIIRIINSVVFAIMHYLLVLILVTVKTNKLDVLSQTSIYSNQNALGLLQISSMIYITWIVFLTIYFVVRTIIYKKKGLTFEHVTVFTNELAKNSRKEKSKVKMVTAPSFIKGHCPVKDNNIIIEKPQSMKSAELLAYEETLTLEDYKLLLNLLKAEKEQKKEKKTSVIIKDNSKEKPLRPQTIVIPEEQPRLIELEDLYKSIS